jgi:hypothetical protein
MNELQDALVRGLQARNRLLLIHAGIGLEVGIFIALTGAPNLIEENFGPWMRVVLGAQSFIPGLLVLLAVGIGLGSRSGRWTALVGVLGLLFWQGTMAVIFALQALQDGDLLPLGEPMPHDAALSYVFLVYVNLALLMLVHLSEIIYSTFYSSTASSSIHLGRPTR